MKYIEKIIKIKRKFNHAKAKSVTTSTQMSGGAEFKTTYWKGQFKHFERLEKINLNKQLGQGDKRNWG